MGQSYAVCTPSGHITQLDELPIQRHGLFVLAIGDEYLLGREIAATATWDENPSYGITRYRVPGTSYYKTGRENLTAIALYLQTLAARARPGIQTFGITQSQH